MPKPYLSFSICRAFSFLVIPMVLGVQVHGIESGGQASIASSPMERLSQDPFQDVERLFSPTKEKPRSIEYVNRGNSKVKHRVSLSEVSEFKCQTVQEFLVNEGVAVPSSMSASGDEIITPTEEHKKILQSLTVSLIRIVNQDSQKDVGIYKRKFCIAEGTSVDGDLMTFAIPLEKRGNGSFKIADGKTDAVVNIGGFSVNMNETSASISAAKVLPTATVSEMNESDIQSPNRSNTEN